MLTYVQPSIEKQKFVSIDIMRGIAILMVMLVHTSQMIGGLTFGKLAVYGQMGVQLFFVASAFTLCYSLEIRRSKDESIISFYLRRFFRIAPGYYAGIIIFFIVNALYSFSGVSSVWKDYSGSPFDILVNVLFLHGFYPPANNNVVPGGWSIATEMLFYLIFPLLINLYSTLQGKFKNAYLIVPVGALTISLLIQYAWFVMTKNPNNFANGSFIYFSLINQFPVFCVGISLYFAYKNQLFKKLKLSTSLLFFVLLSVLSAFLMLFGSKFFTFAHAFAPFISAVSFVFLFVLLQNFQIVTSTLIAKVGVRSYSCYLLHILFAFYLTDFLWHKLEEIMLPDVGLILLYSITVILTYLSSGLMYTYVELKGIVLGKKIIGFINQRKLLTNKPNLTR